MKKLTFHRMQRETERLKAEIKAKDAEIEQLLDFNRRCSADIKAYNDVIDGMIAGKNPCEWCDDNETCQKEEHGKGCGEWMLTWKVQEGVTADGGDKSEAVSGRDSEDGKEAADAESKD